MHGMVILNPSTSRKFTLLDPCSLLVKFSNEKPEKITIKVKHFCTGNKYVV